MSIGGNMSIKITERERFVDKIFIGLQIFSGILFVITGLIGYLLYKFIGIALGIIVGFLFGKWMRYSMGIRGEDPFHGFYTRLRERANDGRRCLLEYLLEKARGNEYTREKCIAITMEYEKALKELANVSNTNEAQRIFHELDKKTKEISYGRTN